MTRTEIINSLIDKNGYKNYLEIGVNTPDQPGYNWEGVVVNTKHGVDPNVDTTYKMTSDEFFANYISQKYDIVFVDGLHLAEQAYKDITNSLIHLNEGGIIVVHDCNPVTEITQRRIRVSDAWHGDVWKAIVKLRVVRSDLDIQTVDTDEGCGLVRAGHQKLLEIPTGINPFDYSFLDSDRKNILNLITPNEFIERYINI